MRCSSGVHKNLLTFHPSYHYYIIIYYYLLITILIIALTSASVTLHQSRNKNYPYCLVDSGVQDSTGHWIGSGEISFNNDNILKQRLNIIGGFKVETPRVQAGKARAKQVSITTHPLNTKKKAVPSDRDGIDGGSSSIEIILDWLTTGSNYPRWRGNLEEGKTKKSLCAKMTQRMKQNGITHRDSKVVFFLLHFFWNRFICYVAIGISLIQ
ncbi:hypothetical protein VP01_1862g2 [Puccinia sorghi]|uniref:Uncharacterized protein n=1 Tax=Puccinia sorghi TaxID=27349 RepID=A0A0L6VDG3_9BASI|nr:hypothetical protein VP01_1862g2 [Puccinia sorghi]